VLEAVFDAALARRVAQREVPAGRAGGGIGRRASPHARRAHRACQSPFISRARRPRQAWSPSSSTTRRCRTCSPGLFVGAHLAGQPRRGRGAPPTRSTELGESPWRRAFPAATSRRRPGCRTRSSGNLLVGRGGQHAPGGDLHRQAVRLAARRTGRQGRGRAARRSKMPPHPRMGRWRRWRWCARWVAAFVQAPYRRPLVRWGQQLHDRFPPPALAVAGPSRTCSGFLEGRGLALPAEAYRPFLELRCPVAGRMEVDGVTLEVRKRAGAVARAGARSPPTAGHPRGFVDSFGGADPGARRGVGAGSANRSWSTAGACRCAPRGRGGRGAVRRAVPAPGRRPHSLHPHLRHSHPTPLRIDPAWTPGRGGSLGRMRVPRCGTRRAGAFDTPPLTAVRGRRGAARAALSNPGRARRGWPAAPLGGCDASGRGRTSAST